MIIFTPVDLPIIKPDSWDVFWELWNDHSKKLVKVRDSHKNSTATLGRDNLWIGMDIFKKYHIPLSWDAPYCDIENSLPKLYDYIKNLDPFIHRVRLIQSQVPFHSHTDQNTDRWEIRAFFHHPSPVQEWYFTKPHDVNGERSYIDMPQETNWFMYNDKHSWHGTDFDPERKKILLQLFTFNNQFSNDLLNRSIEKYKNYTLRY